MPSAQSARVSLASMTSSKQVSMLCSTTSSLNWFQGREKRRELICHLVNGIAYYVLFEVNDARMNLHYTKLQLQKTLETPRKVRFSLSTFSFSSLFPSSAKAPRAHDHNAKGLWPTIHLSALFQLIHPSHVFLKSCPAYTFCTPHYRLKNYMRWWKRIRICLLCTMR